MNVEGRMTIAEFHRAHRARKFHSFILLFASCIWAVGGFAASIELQGQNKGDTNTWTMNNLMGWGELDYIPCRVFFKSGPVVNQRITIFFPHLRGTTPGIQNLSSFTPSPNAVITSVPALTTDPSGTWSYAFTVSVTNNSPGYVRFRARLAAGSHLNSGSSLQLDGDPQSMGQLQIHKPGPGAALPDLAIVKTGPLTIPQGEMITYTLAYTNKDGAITNTGMGVQICDILPTDIIVNPSSLPPGGELVGNTIFFDLTNIAAHASGQITFQALVPFATPVGRVLTNFSQILCSQDDADFSDNTSTWLTTVIGGCVAPTITSNPGDAMKCPGDSVTFTVGASGTAPLFYQWRKNGGEISGATGSSYTIIPVAANDSGTYDVVVTNACGSATSSVAVLDANDTTLPTISCPADVIVAANAECTATNVNLGTPITSDNCSVTAVTNNAPAIFPLGTNVVTWTVVDSSGNLNSCAQRVIVRDETPPSITCSSNLVFTADAGQCSRSNITFIIAASDNCGVANLTSVPPSGSTLPIGTTTVTNIATDASGNTATCTFTVTVTDNEPPVIICPTNIVVGADTGECIRSSVSFTVTATDNCSITNLTSTPPSGSTFPVGTTTVTNVATDASGNTATCTFAITVVAEPIVTIPPVDQTVCEGDAASFNVVATGASLTYQWFKGTNLLSGATNSSLALLNVTTNDAAEYCVRVSGACGSPVTNCASLTVNLPVTATSLTNQTVCHGSTIVFSTVAGGTGPFSYQWFQFVGRFNFPLPGETNNTLLLQDVSLRNAGTYSVIVSGACGRVAKSASLTVRELLTDGLIFSHTNCPGTTVQLERFPASTDLSYQWFQVGSDLVISTNRVLTLTNITADDAGTYTLIVTGPCNSVTNSATLTVNEPVSATGPSDQTNCVGTIVTFSTVAHGTGPFTYQWRKDGENLRSRTTSSIEIFAFGTGTVGTYSVIVGGACGSVTNSATLTVIPRLEQIALSSRTNCEGTMATFATPPGPALTYQWYHNASVLTDETNNSVTISNVTVADTGTYSVVVAGPCNTVTNSGTLTVNSGVVVIAPPQDQNICPGAPINLSVVASGTGLAYQWFAGNTLLPGETNSSLTLASGSSGEMVVFTVVISGACGSAVTNSATVTFKELAGATPLANLFQNPGTTATFSTTASGTGPLAYQWKKDGVAIIGETTNSLVLADITFDSAGTYAVVVSGPCDSVERSGTLTVNHPPEVSILTPTNGQVFNAGQNISIVASANDSDGSVTNVEIFVGTNTLAEISAPPYETTLTNPPAGMYELRARATDNLGLAGTSAPVNISVIEQPPLIILTNIYLNRQSGYYEEVVRVFNPTAFASNTVGVLVFGVQSPIQVVNYTLLINGIPYVQNGNAIPPGGFADIKIKFYVPLNVTNIPPPTLVAIVMPAVATASVSGTPVEITRSLLLADGSILLNFKTVLGPTYFVEYSGDMVLWTTSPQTVAGTGFTAQWIDDGPPATGTFPPPSNTRFYRVSRVP